MSVYVHNIDPFALQFPDALRFGALHVEGIRWYGLAYLAGFLVGYFCIRWMAQKGTTPIKVVEVADFITMVAVGTMVGGRLGYCLFYSPQLFLDFTSSPPFWGIFKVYEGGMSSHGGMIGVLIVCAWWARTRKIDIFHMIDLVCLGGAMGFFFGRIANFINGELWGREAPPDLSWAVKFPQEMYFWTSDNLPRLMEIGPAVEKLGSVQNSSGETIQLTSDVWRNWVQHYRADVQSWNMVNSIVEKLITAIQSGQTQVSDALAPFLTARYPSQLIQSGLEGFCVALVIVLLWLKPRKPGVIASAFGILYAVARIIGEQFRMPDAQIGFQWLGLTRGQWLSVVMILLMGVFVYFMSKRKVEPMGGWGLNVKKNT